MPQPESRHAHQRSRAAGGLLALALAVASFGACARVSTENVDVRAVGLPRPQIVYVHDFSVSPGAVSLDSAVGARLMEMAKGTPEAEAQLQVGQELARIVTTQLVEEIRKTGLPAEPAPPGVAMPASSLSVEGQFLSVDEGNRLRRMVIGFGAGASEVRTLVQIFETGPEGRRLVEDFYTTVKSSRKPGMGPMAGVGAAAGRAATSAALSAGVGVMTERSQTVEGDARNAANEIAKLLKKFFAEQGWIAPQ